MTAADTLTTAATYPSPLTRLDLDPAIAAAFGLSADLDTITRTEAMRVPSVRRARATIAGTIGSMRWETRRGNQRIDRPLIDHPDPNTTPQWLYTWTVDDLLFNGIAWWRVLDTDAQGYPTRVERVARERVMVSYADTMTPRGRVPAWRVYLDGREAGPEELIRFDGPDEGCLAYGASVLRTCVLLDQAVRRFARLDVPLGYLTPAEGAQELQTAAGSAGIPNDDRSEVDVLLDNWEDARAHRSTAFLNRALTYQTVQFDADRIQLAEARQYQAAEVARLMNLPPRYVNAPQASGMTYATTEGDRRDLLDTTLAQYIAAIAQRLSMPDVTPRGQSVGPDVASFLRGDTASVLAAAEVGIRSGVYDPNEIRTDWLGLQARPLPAAPPNLRAVPDPLTGDNRQ